MIIKVIAGLFMITSMNAWNLIDVMDGLTGWVTVFTFLGIAIITYFLDPSLISVSLFSFIMVAVILGFLFWNHYPAKIFLGDTGSLLIGMFFSIFALEIYSISPKIIFLILLLSSVPFFELIFLIIVRTKKGIPFYIGSPDHFVLRMIQKGFTIKQILNYVKMYLTLQLVFVLLLFNYDIYYIFIATFIFVVVSFAIAFKYFHSLPASEV